VASTPETTAAAAAPTMASTSATTAVAPKADLTLAMVREFFETSADEDLRNDPDFDDVAQHLLIRIFQLSRNSVVQVPQREKSGE